MTGPEFHLHIYRKALRKVSLSHSPEDGMEISILIKQHIIFCQILILCFYFLTCGRSSGLLPAAASAFLLMLVYVFYSGLLDSLKRIFFLAGNLEGILVYFFYSDLL